MAVSQLLVQLLSKNTTKKKQYAKHLQMTLGAYNYNDK